MHLPLAFFQNLGLPEYAVIGIFALLLFGKRLPEVARSLGKSFVEFKRGLQGAQDEFRMAGTKEETQESNDPPKSS